VPSARLESNEGSDLIRVADQTVATRRCPATESNRAASLCRSAVFASSLTGHESRSGGNRTLSERGYGPRLPPWVAAIGAGAVLHRPGRAYETRLGARSTLPAARLLGVEPRAARVETLRADPPPQAQRRAIRRARWPRAWESNPAQSVSQTEARFRRELEEASLLGVEPRATGIGTRSVDPPRQREGALARSRTEPLGLEDPRRGPPGQAQRETPTRVARVHAGLQSAPTAGCRRRRAARG
jgi:hypothetical protein